MARIHRAPSPESPEPFFGPAPGAPPTSRFDDPRGIFHVCYLGLDATASFAETFLRQPPTRLITTPDLDGRYLSLLHTTRDLTLAQLYGPGLARVGCTALITSSLPPYHEAQALARTLWEHASPPLLDGMVYLCRHDNERKAIALFDRARDALTLDSTEPLLANKTRLLEWRRIYGFDIG